MSTARPKSGGPRRAAHIFQTTLALVAERGYGHLTMEAVAVASGVNKTTLYRWWPSKDALLAAALTESDALSIEIPDEGSLAADLRNLAQRITELLTAPATAPIAQALLTAGADRPELAEVARRFFDDRAALENPIFERAVRRGELADAGAARRIMDLIAGAIWFRVLVHGATPTDADLDDIVRIVVDGVGG